MKHRNYNIKDTYYIIKSKILYDIKAYFNSTPKLNEFHCGSNHFYIGNNEVLHLSYEDAEKAQMENADKDLITYLNPTEEEVKLYKLHQKLRDI